MNTRRVVLIAVALAAVTSCTPYQEINPDKPAGAAVPPVKEGAASDVSTGSNDGGAMQVDQSVGVVYEIRTRSDIPAFVASQMALADKDSNRELSKEEYHLIAAALAQADNSFASSSEGGPVANPGVGGVIDSSDAVPVGRDEFFAISAGQDGAMSAADLELTLASRFDAADADSDGTLDAAESKDFAASMLLGEN